LLEYRKNKSSGDDEINQKLLWGSQGAVFSKRAPWPPEAKVSKLTCNNFCATWKGIVKLSGKQNNTVIPINGESEEWKLFKKSRYEKTNVIGVFQTIERICTTFRIYKLLTLCYKGFLKRRSQ
jgi:hypothetical protein